MTDKLVYIPNDDKQNYPFCRLDGWNVCTLNLMNQLIKNQAPKNVVYIFEDVHKFIVHCLIPLVPDF